jgi:excisionase family DNA binding protein
MRKRRPVQLALDDRLTVTIDRTAEVLDVGRSTIYELLRAGKLKGVKFGRAHRVVVQSIRDLIAHPDNEASSTAGVGPGAAKEVRVQRPGNGEKDARF